MFRLARTLLAIAFFVPALLKWRAFALYGVSGVIPPELMPLVIGGECAAALFVAVSNRLRFVWLAGLLILLALASYHLYAIGTGSQSCGCLGSVEVAHSTLLGSIAFALIVWCGLRPASDLNIQKNARDSVTEGACLGILTIGLLGCFLLLVSDGVDSQVVQISPKVVDLGLVPAEFPVAFSVYLANQSSEPVTITGGGVNCGCLTLQKLPLTIPARSGITLNAELIPQRDSPGVRRTQHFTYYLDLPRQHQVRGSVIYIAKGKP